MRWPIWRKVLIVLVLIASAVYIGYFLTHHHEIIDQLRKTPLSLIILLVGLYLFMFGSLVLINTATLKLCRIKASAGEIGLLTMYTAIINFFGPLQSGPAFRAVYLKKRYDVNLKEYGAATLAYYFFFALYSGLFLVSGIFKWWTLVLPILAIAGIFILNKYSPVFRKKVSERWQKLNGRAWLFLALSTLLQVAIVAVIYYAELQFVAPATTPGQAIIYTGAANMALFVSLTPAAIGFREAFLLFSRRLHHIDISTIITASLIDRSVYVITLLLMAVVIFGTHANNLLKRRASA